MDRTDAELTIDSLLIPSVRPPITAHLQREREWHPQFSEDLDKIEDTLQRRLYHQFTDLYTEYVRKVIALNGDPLRPVAFAVCVAGPHRERLNVARFLVPLRDSIERLNPEDALRVLGIYENHFRDHVPAYVLYLAIKAHNLVRAGQLTEAETLLLDTSPTLLTSQLGLDVAIWRTFHAECAFLHKAAGRIRDFYDSCLMELEYTLVSKDIPQESRGPRAFELIVAGLVAPSMYNYSDLSQQPLVLYLVENQDDPELRQHAWILDFLEAAMRGALDKFELAICENAKEIEKTPLLKNHIEDLREKMSLLALMELAFTKPKKNRVLKFADISAACNVSLEETEFLIMKGMALNLIKGHMDQVEDLVRVSWVKPRVVDAAKLQTMKQRLMTWSDEVGTLVAKTEEFSKELLTAG